MYLIVYNAFISLQKIVAAGDHLDDPTGTPPQFGTLEQPINQGAF